MSPQEIFKGQTDVGAAPPSRKTQPFYWSVRRELWENRSIYIAPLAVAALVLVGLLIGASHLPPDMIRKIARLEPERQAQALSIPFGIAAGAIMVTALIVGVFYSLGALQSERRDRSILFWKSLPVSDITTVMSKAFVPLVILPMVALGVMLAALLVIIIISAILLPVNGLPPTLLLSSFPVGRVIVELTYVLVVFALWHAPIWGWLMLVSGWARRASFLWAFGPPLALVVFEKLAFNTGYLWSLIHYRVAGAFGEAFTSTVATGARHADLPQMDPLKFMFTPGLWLGLLAAALLFAAVVWQRRYRSPI